MRTHVTTAFAVLVLGAQIAAAQQAGAAKPAAATGGAQAGAQAATSSFSPRLAGLWKSAPSELKLTGEFEESVWGKDATSVRTVDLRIDPSGKGTLTVTRKVVDAKGETVVASTSIEEATLEIGGSQETIAGRIEHDVKVVSAERRYPDDKEYRWPLDGLEVKIVTFADGDGNTLEVRFDTPEGRGSFWETLTRAKGSRES